MLLAGSILLLSSPVSLLLLFRTASAGLSGVPQLPAPAGWGTGAALRPQRWWGRSKFWASASPWAGHTVKQQLAAGLSFSRSPVAQPHGAFSSLIVFVQGVGSYSNKALRLLVSGAPQSQRGQRVVPPWARWKMGRSNIGSPFTKPCRAKEDSSCRFSFCKSSLSLISFLKTFICSLAPAALPVPLQTLCPRVEVLLHFLVSVGAWFMVGGAMNEDQIC